ncbi:MAG: hypothetical protein ABI663_10460 [Chryseolinea sp.]
MEDFIFHEGPVPSRYSFSFTESLFNQRAHRQLQSESDWHSFYILNQKSYTVDGAVHFHLRNGIAQSPFRAAHGGFNLREGLEREIILSFVKFTEQQLRKSRATKILIKLPLRLSDENEFSLTEDILRTIGFQISKKEEGCILRVTESFDDRIHYSKKKRLKKTTRSNFQFSSVDIGELKGVYLFLLKCRREKGYELSMSLEEISDLASQLPDKILLFAVKDGEQLVAASICIRISNEVLYDFYHDHAAFYDDYSPIVFLVKGIHDYCYSNHIPLIDLGTAMIGDKVNTGLLEFKLKLGADHAVKYSFEKIV